MAQVKRSEGEVLDGRYRLGKRLGRGGFGDVWRAEELLPDGTTLREVALKRITLWLAVVIIADRYAPGGDYANTE